MDFGQLSLFVMLARCRQFTAAAEQAFMSQSSFSKHIKSLEEEIGVKLFIRSAKGVELTPAGDRFYEFARVSLDAKHDAMNDISSYMEEHDKNAAVGVMPVIAYYGIAQMFSAYGRHFPQFTLQTYEDKVAEIVRLLSEGVVNIALACNGMVDTDKFAEHMLYQDRVVLVVPSNHPLAKREEVSLKCLADETFIVMDGSIGLINIINSYCMEYGFTPRIACSCRVPSSLFSMVREGFGVSLLPLNGPISVNTENVKIVNICEAPPANLVLLSSKKRSMNKAEMAFLDFALKWYQQD